MSYKVICIDVDGTLLGESGIIPEENILAIEQAYKKGVQQEEYIVMLYKLLREYR